jgi:hypothetical protein
MRGSPSELRGGEDDSAVIKNFPGIALPQQK